MGRSIIKQPNGKLAVWSTIVDNFILDDATKQEYIAIRIKEETEKINETVTRIVDRLDSGKRQSYASLTWEEALKEIEYRHGKEELDKVLKEIE